MSKHPLGWEDGDKFPKRSINNPPEPVEGMWVGVCIFCGGSLGGPYEEDLFHRECLKVEE
jgi:hypothetical protein